MIPRLFALPAPPPRGVRMPPMPRAARDLAMLKLREAGLSPQEIGCAFDVLPHTVGIALRRARKAQRAESRPEEMP